jgi:hypothetical protein
MRVAMAGDPHISLLAGTCGPADPASSPSQRGRVGILQYHDLETNASDL